MSPRDSNTILKNVSAGQQYQLIRNQVDQLCEKYRRDPASVTIVGACKKQNLDTINGALTAGLENLGENFVDGAIDKQDQLANAHATWHYIGHIQSNKTKLLAKHFSWVHTVDRLKIAQRLNDHIEKTQARPLNILLQVNIDEEPSKSGVSIEQVHELAEQCGQFNHLSLRGLMVIPRARENFDEQCGVFAQTRSLLESINNDLSLKLDQLSMGMSNDIEAAVKEGATLIRIGTALFGERK